MRQREERCRALGDRTPPRTCCNTCGGSDCPPLRVITDSARAAATACVRCVSSHTVACLPYATHATPGHSETRPLYRSGVFLFHRGLPFHQSCFNLIAPSFILCPQFVQIGGPRCNEKTPLHKTSLQASGDPFASGVLDTTPPNNGHVRKYWHT